MARRRAPPKVVEEEEDIDMADSVSEDEDADADADADVAEDYSDADAEGEEAESEDKDADVAEEEEEYSEADAEGEEADENDADSEVVGPVKRQTRARKARPASDNDGSSEGYETANDGGSDESSESSSEQENEWDVDNDAVEEDDAGNHKAGHCVFCGQDEEHDPGEDYEEYLTCAVCGDNAHRFCARESDALKPSDDTAHWRCRDCVANGLEEDEMPDGEDSLARRRSSAPKLARDLLPAVRGGIKPNSHSVFNTLILDDDPMDGSRSLRKRRSSDSDVEEVQQNPRKKRQISTFSDGEDRVIRLASRTATEHAITDGQDGEDEDHVSNQRSVRPRRAQRSQLVRIVMTGEDPKSIVMGFAISAAALDGVEKNAQKKQRRRERDRARRLQNQQAAATIHEEPPSHYPSIATTMYSNPFYAFPDRETDELKGKPYGGILTEAEADTTKTYPQQSDREVFENARRRAEEDWRRKIEAQALETSTKPKTSGPPSKIKCINFGKFEIDTWHAAPYPEEYNRNRVLYICEFCLKYMSSDFVAWRHKLKCPARHPPGDEIYRAPIINPETNKPTTLSFFEVDGRRNPLYCQNLCLLAKLFLGSKTLYYDVEPFLFYVMTENDEFGCHFVGYFSKEKRGLGPSPTQQPHTSFDHDSPTLNGLESTSQENEASVLSNPGNNVSCILVLPIHMRRGFGRVLIEFSYALTKVEGRTGSPEKPLSDMGLVSYRSYWRGILCKLLLEYKDKSNELKPPSIASIAKDTGMTPDDIVSTLEALRFLVRDPVTRTYALRLDYEYMKGYVDKQEKKAHIHIDPTKLIWTPYVMGRPTNYFPLGEEASAPIQTKAPRNEPDDEDGVLNGMDQPKQSTELKTPLLDAETNDANEDVMSPRTLKKTPGTTPLLPSEPGTVSRDHGSIRKVNGYSESLNGLGIYHRRGSGDTFPSNISVSTSSSHIPPTRFEVFPPIPGMVAKRKAGRPFGSRSTRRASGYLRRSATTPARSRAGVSNRKARSNLGDAVGLDGTDETPTLSSAPFGTSDSPLKEEAVEDGEDMAEIDADVEADGGANATEQLDTDMIDDAYDDDEDADADADADADVAEEDDY